MKALPTVNQKSVYAAAGLIYADITNNTEITDPILKATLRLKALQTQNAAFIAELKNRQLEQIDKLNNIKTEMRIVEVKNFNSIPLEENKNGILKSEYQKAE
jgi:cytoplasmic iron level regulating protein YaaA (DUF328/UPF0246 family)